MDLCIFADLKYETSFVKELLFKMFLGSQPNYIKDPTNGVGC